MSIERIVSSDFTGGQVPRFASTDFSERQWANIRGFVFEDPARLRTQWSIQRMGAGQQGFDQLMQVGSRMVARKPDGTFWWLPQQLVGWDWQTTRGAVWQQLTGIAADTNLRLVCQVPINVDGVGFATGLLVNGVHREGNAHIIVPSGTFSSPTMTVESFPRWPASEGDPFIPPANVGGMWGDFLVLGNVRWLDDESAPFGGANNRWHPNMLWFSSPTDVAKWDVLDTQPVSFYTGDTSHETVRDLHQLDSGLVVVTQSGAAILLGTADDYDLSPLRPGTGAGRDGCLTFWSQIGALCWVDAGGRLWAANGQEFTQLNEGTGLPTRKDVASGVAGWLSNLLVAHEDGRLLYMKALETEGVWGELVTPSPGVRWLQAFSGAAHWLDDDGRCWRMTISEALESERGLADGQPLELRLATRTYERLGGHESSIWHRFGFRGRGPGTLMQIVLRPGPALDDTQPTLVHDLNVTMDERHEVVVRGHGPSSEASAELRFQGDVELEQVSWWVHAGRGRR